MKPPATRFIHIFDTRIPTPRPTCLIDRHKRLPRPVLVLGIPRGTISIVIALDDLGSQDVVAVGDPEARRVVERRLVGRRRRVVGRVEGVLCVLPGEDLGADAGQGRAVGVVAPVDEGEAEFGVVGLVEG